MIIKCIDCAFFRQDIYLFFLNLIKIKGEEKWSQWSYISHIYTGHSVICVVIRRPNLWLLSWVHLPNCDSQLLTVKSYCVLNSLLTYCCNCYISAYSAISAAASASTQRSLSSIYAFTINCICFALLLYSCDNSSVWLLLFSQLVPDGDLPEEV